MGSKCFIGKNFRSCSVLCFVLFCFVFSISRGRWWNLPMISFRRATKSHDWLMYRMKSYPQPLWHSEIARHENPVINRPTSETYHFFLVGFFCVCGSTLTRSLFVLLHNPCVSCAGLTFEISFMLVLFLFSRLIKKQPISLDIWRKKDGFWNKYVSTSDLIQSTDGWGR